MGPSAAVDLYNVYPYYYDEDGCVLRIALPINDEYAFLTIAGQAAECGYEGSSTFPGLVSGLAKFGSDAAGTFHVAAVAGADPTLPWFYVLETTNNCLRLVYASTTD